LGANKFELIQQYTGQARMAETGHRHTERDRAMAKKKRLRCKKDAGFQFFRISASGYFPVQANERSRSDLTLWSPTDPAIGD